MYSLSKLSLFVVINSIDYKAKQSKVKSSEVKLVESIYKLDELYKWRLQMNRLVGKPTICIGENKDADQLRGNREADQRLCFRY